MYIWWVYQESGLYGIHHGTSFSFHLVLGDPSGRNFDDPPDGFGGTGGDATNVHEPWQGGARKNGGNKNHPQNTGVLKLPILYIYIAGIAECECNYRNFEWFARKNLLCLGWKYLMTLETSTNNTKGDHWTGSQDDHRMSFVNIGLCVEIFLGVVWETLSPSWQTQLFLLFSYFRLPFFLGLRSLQLAQTYSTSHLSGRNKALFRDD